jgi:hypothetical protein
MQGGELADVTTRDVVQAAVQSLDNLVGRVFDVFDVVAVTKPVTSDAAVNLAKVVSKLSPFMGNTIEFNTVELLNDQKEFRESSEWQRQECYRLSTVRHVHTLYLIPRSLFSSFALLQYTVRSYRSRTSCTRL